MSVFLHYSGGTPGSQCLFSAVQWWNTWQSVSVFCSTVVEHLAVSVCFLQCSGGTPDSESVSVFLQYRDGTPGSQCLFSAA